MHRFSHFFFTFHISWFDELIECDLNPAGKICQKIHIHSPKKCLCRDVFIAHWHFFIVLAWSSSPWENSSHSIHELNFHQNHMGRRYYYLKCLFSHFCKILHWSITITCRASNFFLAPQFSYFKCSTLWLSTYVLHIQRFHKTCQSSSFTYIFFCHLTCELRSSEEMLYTQ